MRRKKGNLTRLLVICLLLVILAGSAPAEDVKIVTWNVKDVFTVEGANSRQSDFSQFKQQLQPDIVLIQEVTSRQVVEAIRDAMGLTGYYIACSDFVQSDSASRAAFEVAVISKYPFSQVIEYDPSPDNVEEDDPEESPLTVPKNVPVDTVGTSRGYLWVSIDDIALNLFVVHLKSSLGLVGYGDRNNAKKREFVMASLAWGVLEDIDLLEGYAILVGGDFNIGHSDKSKNGTDLEEDSYSASSNEDKYDETHALLSAGLVGGLKMKNITLGITDTTYPGYPGSPIDNMYITGEDMDEVEKQFTAAQKGNQTFGSDHLPVWTVYSAP